MNGDIEIKDLSENYNSAFPNYPPLVCFGKWLYGMWMLGNNYKGATYYGSYPPSYLKRILSIFPFYSHEDILHLFSGSLASTTIGLRFDISKDCNPDVVGDAHKLSSYFPERKFSLIIANPPYSGEDALHYGTPMANRNLVLRECFSILENWGFVVWLDQVLPIYRKVLFDLVGTIGLIRSTNHRVRSVFIFRKVPS